MEEVEQSLRGKIRLRYLITLAEFLTTANLNQKNELMTVRNLEHDLDSISKRVKTLVERLARECDELIGVYIGRKEQNELPENIIRLSRVQLFYKI